MTYIKHNGAWVQPTATYVKHNGVWVITTPYVKHSGAWVNQAPADTTPPAAPTVSTSVIDGKYFNVGVSVGSSDVTDLDTVRVLISAAGYPGSWYASGRVDDIDHSYPEEIWSDWKYHNGVRNNSSVVTYKAYPPNADEGGAALLTAGTYYISAFAMDTSGNISAAGQATAVIPYAPPVDPTPTPTTSTYTSDFTANWSKSWYGNATGTANDGDVFSNGERLRSGFWPDAGRMIAALGFPETDIANALKGATITKVQLRLHTREQYRSKGNVRFRYHARTDAPTSWDSSWDFGPTNEVMDWPDWTTKWIDITADSPTQWKTKAKTGIFLAPPNDSLDWAICIAGHKADHPPLIRFTYTK